MKKLLFLATATLCMLGCSKQTTEPTSDLNTELTVRIVGSDSRAVGALPTDPTESTIKSVDVLIFAPGADGALVNTYSFVANDLAAKKAKFSVKAGNVDIYVVANAAAGTFGAVTKKSEFTAIKATLAQAPDGLPMVSETLNHTLQMGPNTLAAQVTRLVSRVAIGSITVIPNLPNATFTPEKVFMLNANTESTFASSIAGEVTPGTLGYGSMGATTPGGVLVADLGSNYTDVSDKAFFYIFENKGTGAGNTTKPTNPTRLVIEGKWDADGAGTAFTPVATYYAVTINEPVKDASNPNSNTSAGTDGTYVNRNTQYTLNVTIKGQGQDDPTTEPTNTSLEVSVTVDPWQLITQTVSFE